MPSTRNHTFNPGRYLEQTDREIRAAKKQVDELNQLIEGLEAARSAMSSHILNHASETRGSDKSSRVAALKEILETSSEAVSIDEMVKELRKMGHMTTKPAVSATLSYLRRCNAVKNVDRGRWQSVTTKAA